MMRWCVALPALLLIAAAPADWTSSVPRRLAALQALQALNADLLSHDSATLTLERWCASHKLAPVARIVAERQAGPVKPLAAQGRTDLGIGPDTPVRYRHVRLACGSVVLSDAENWYVPALLTPAMNHVLDSADTPFGRAVAALGFHRHTLAADMLWTPLPAGWDMARATTTLPPAPPLPATVLRHRAILRRADGTPFAEVIESYTAAVLGTPGVGL